MEDTTKKFVMILEKSSHNLSVSSDGDDVILEGIFAQFGIVNNNDRIYEESEYLPHMEYLNKKIEGKRLLGELDHPEKFDISLSKVSHVIEKLDYIKESRQIKGRLRLLDTPSGRIAKELVKGGVPISISSRAAGLVESNKKVRIKKIFTYDLVADPGFENAVLNRINESLGIHSDLISVYEVGEDLNNYLLGEEIDNTQKTNENMDFVTPKELHDYSLIVKKEIEKLNENIDTLKVENPVNEQISTLNKAVSKIEKYLEYMSGVSDHNIQYSEYLAAQLESVSTLLDKNISYTEYVSTVMENENLKLSESINANILETRQNSDLTGNVIKYAEQISESIDKKNKMISEKLKSGIKYSNYLAKKLDQGIAYTEHIAENSSKGIDYAEYLAEQLSNAIEHQDYLAENLEKGIKYTEYIGEQAQAVADYTEFAITESEKIYTTNTNTNLTTVSEADMDYSSLSGKVDAILESVKKQKIGDLNESMKHGNVRLPDESIMYSFVSLLNETKREEFRNLDDAKKQKVASALNGKTLTTEEEILQLWESALHPRSEKWIEEAPLKYKTVWESLDENQKRTLVAQSRTYKLDTDYQIKNFWETRSANLTTSSNSQNLNESEKVEGFKAPSLGYSEEYLQHMKTLLGKYTR